MPTFHSLSSQSKHAATPAASSVSLASPFACSALRMLSLGDWCQASNRRLIEALARSSSYGSSQLPPLPHGLVSCRSPPVNLQKFEVFVHFARL